MRLCGSAARGRIIPKATAYSHNGIHSLTRLPTVLSTRAEPPRCSLHPGARFVQTGDKSGTAASCHDASSGIRKAEGSAEE